MDSLITGTQTHGVRARHLRQRPILWQDRTMHSSKYVVHFELSGWDLFWAQLEVVPGHDQELAALRARVVERVAARYQLATLSTHPTVAAMRALFRAAGCDPTRYRPASEALLRRLLKGNELPAIQPLVDVNNCLSAELAVPCCVMAEGTFTPPFTFRAGVAGEQYDSLRGGPFNLAAKPVLADTEGPLDVPVTGSQRVKVQAQTRRALLVSYLPHGVLTPEEVERVLASLVAEAPAVAVEYTAASSAED